MLTNIRAASVEQLLVHHRHAVLGERTGQSGKASFSSSQKWGGRVRELRETSASILACVSGPAGRQATSFTLVVPMALAGPQHLPSHALRLLCPPLRHPTDPLRERIGPQGLWESGKR